MFISNAGSQMQLWALFWHLRALSDQPVTVSGIGLARFLPLLLFSLFGGVVADRFNRRSIMFISQVVMTLTALGFWALTGTGVIRIWHLYILTAIQAAALAFDIPARHSIIPNLVPRRDLTNAFSLTSISNNLGSIIGPSLSGFVIGYLGQEYTYLLNAVSFLAVIISLILIGPVAQETIASAGRKNSFNAIREGVQFIRSHPIILSSMLLDFFATFFSAANTLLPFVAVDILGVGPVAYGWLSAGQAVGAATIGLIISQRLKIAHQGRLILISVAVFGLATIAFGLSRTFTITMISLILVGGADAVSTILRNTIRQVLTPDYIRGRMVSINQIFFYGGPQLGEIEAGLAAQFFGPSLAIISGGAGCILAVAVIAWRWSSLRTYDGSESE